MGEETPLAPQRQYTCANTPTLEQFHADDSFVRGIMGPINSGKSSACVMEIMRRAKTQAPYHGIRRTRHLIVRENYPKLVSTTIKSWLEWFPETRITEHESPIRTSIRGLLPDGTKLDMELWFLALNKHDPDQVGSMQVSNVWVNEAREIYDQAAFDNLTRPQGRFPPLREGGPSWHGIIMDTNPPPIGHWWHKMAEVVRPVGWRFFRQPGALIRNPKGILVENPLAENWKNVSGGYNYWLEQCAGKDVDWISNMVLGEYGQVWSGRPVYEGSYSDTRHVSKKPLEIMRGLPIFLGWDFGLTPSCPILQVKPNGQIHCLREYACLEQTGLQQFVAGVVKPALAREFAGIKEIISFGDPSGPRSGIDEVTPFMELTRQGIFTSPAPTNRFSLRREAVLNVLNRSLGDESAFLLDPSCTMLRRGFQGGYQFKRIRISTGEGYSEEAEKNEFSHIHDALQYAMLGIEATVRGDQRERKVWPERKGWPL